MLVFIVNPSSSSGEGLKIWNRAKERLVSHGASFKVVSTRGPGDTARIAKRLSSLSEDVTTVIVGGDGTISDFITGLERFSSITLACIPTGSGNDYVRGHNLPVSPDDCVDMILRRKRIMAIDVGEVRARGKTSRFAVSSGMGYDALVCYHSGSSPLKKALNALHLGGLIYSLNAARLLMTVKKSDITVETDDGVETEYKDAYLCVAMNLKYEGGGFMFTPDAVPTDGMLDIMIAHRMPRWKVAMTLPGSRSGKHVGKDGIHIIRTSSARIKSSSPQCVHTDGEHFGFFDEISFSILPGALKVIM